MNSRSILTSMLLAASALMSPGIAAAAEINLYTTREPALIAPLLGAFSKSTGTKVNTIFLRTASRSVSPPKAPARQLTS